MVVEHLTREQRCCCCSCCRCWFQVAGCGLLLSLLFRASAPNGTTSAKKLDKGGMRSYEVLSGLQRPQPSQENTNYRRQKKRQPTWFPEQTLRAKNPQKFQPQLPGQGTQALPMQPPVTTSAGWWSFSRTLDAATQKANITGLKLNLGGRIEFHEGTSSRLL